MQLQLSCLVSALQLLLLLMISGNGLNEYIEIDAKACDVTIKETNDFVKAVNFPFNKFLLSGTPERMAEVEKIMDKEFGDRMNVFRSDLFLYLLFLYLSFQVLMS